MQQHQSNSSNCNSIDFNYRHHSYITQSEQSSTEQTMTATKPLYNPLHISNDGNTNSENLSNSEPHLCDHFIHDINCAKNKSLLHVPDI